MISFVTSNKGKFAEARGIFGDLEQKNIGYTEIQADTLEEVAIFGMKEVSSRLQGPVMLEDAGLFVEALRVFLESTRLTSKRPSAMTGYCGLWKA